MTRKRLIAWCSRGCLALTGVLVLAASSAPVTGGALPGRNGRIAYAGHEGDNDESLTITSVTRDGRRPHLISDDGEEPAYSPAGRWIAFGASYGDGIWIKSAIGRGRARRVTKGSNDTEPDWSPSGKRLVFTRSGDCNVAVCGEIWIYAGGRSRRLVRGTSPAWSARGEIAFTGSEGTADGIYVIRPDGTGLRRVVDSGHHPDWSPDGRRIVFATAFPNLDIATVRANGSGLRRLTAGPSEDIAPSFSPDGRRIVFARGSEPSRLVVMRSNGARPRTILEFAEGFVGATDWQPLRGRFAAHRDTRRRQ
jgi:TolB protein